MSRATIIRSIRDRSVNHPLPYGNYPLHLAVRYNELDLVKALILERANLDVQNADQETPLHIALKHRSFEIVEYFMSRGARVDIADRTQKTVLDLATTTKKHDGTISDIGRRIIDLYLERPVNIDAIVNPITGDTLLHLAVKYDLLELYNTLRSLGARVDIENEDKKTVLNLWDALPSDSDFKIPLEKRLASYDEKQLSGIAYGTPLEESPTYSSSSSAAYRSGSDEEVIGIAGSQEKQSDD